VTATPNAMKDFTVVRMDFSMWLYLCPNAENIDGHGVFTRLIEQSVFFIPIVTSQGNRSQEIA